MKYKNQYSERVNGLQTEHRTPLITNRCSLVIGEYVDYPLPILASFTNSQCVRVL